MRTSVALIIVGLLFLLASCTLLAACAEGPASESATREGATWTLEEDLRIDEEEGYYLGSVADVAVRADETLLVLDREEYHVKLISPVGDLLRTVGRQGEGPGEFRRPSQMSLARGDSLYVLDGGRSLSVFAPTSYTLARTVQLSGSPEGRRYPAELMVSPEKGFLVSYAVPPALGSEAAPILYQIGEGGEPLGRVDIPQQGQQRIRLEAKRTVMPLEIPFGRQSVVGLGPEGHLYYGITDSLTVAISNLSGRELDRWFLPAEPRPVTDDDLRVFADDYADYAAATFGKEIREATRVALDDALREADLPETQPAFYGLLVDDRQRVWIRRDPEHVETATWWVTSANGELLAELTLPGNVQLEAVRGGYAYGAIRGGAALPSVVRYRIKEAI